MFRACPGKVWSPTLYFPKQVGFNQSKEKEGFLRALLHFQHQPCSICPGPDASQAPWEYLGGGRAHSFAPHTSVWCSRHLQQLSAMENIIHFETSPHRKQSHRLGSWLPTRLHVFLSPPVCPGISPPVGFLTAPSLPSWKHTVCFSPSPCPSATCLQVTEGQCGLCFNLIPSRPAAFSRNEPLLPRPALSFIPS